MRMALIKKVEGPFTVGAGCQLLISRTRKNNPTGFEKVAAATFGKGFGQGYKSGGDAGGVSVGQAHELRNKHLTIQSATDDIDDR